VHRTDGWRDVKIDKLTFEIAQLKRLRYGVKSEQLTAEQRALFDEAVSGDIAAIEEQLAELQAAMPPKADGEKRARRPGTPGPSSLTLPLRHRLRIALPGGAMRPIAGLTSQNCAVPPRATCAGDNTTLALCSGLLDLRLLRRHLGHGDRVVFCQFHCFLVPS
jgi:hypothetical protein